MELMLIKEGSEDRNGKSVKELSVPKAKKPEVEENGRI